MPSRHMTPLLLCATPDAVRGKYRHARGAMRRRWEHFLALARHDGEWYGLSQPLAYMVTGDAAFRRQARAAFLRYAELVPECALSLEGQVHTHVVSAPLGHWAILYDWMREMEILNPAERTLVEEALLSQAQLSAMTQAQGRSRGYENQIFSNAFGCAAVGLVLGERRGKDPLARRLLGLGLAWLRALLADLPEDGYTLEGSTYHEQVSIPVTLWGTLVYEAATGEEIFDRPFGAHGMNVRGMLAYTARLIGPGGLLPPWDAYGHQQASVCSYLAYLARRTGETWPTAILDAVGMWDRMAHPAWECHDRMWTLAWWPENHDTQSEACFRAWMGTATAGALQDRGTRTRLFQYWDACGGLAYCGRTEANPNAISFEAMGSPLLVDGAPGDSGGLAAGAVDEILAYAGEGTIARYADSWGLQGKDRITRAAVRAVAGHVGLSNSLHFDGEDWYVPKAPVRGEGVACHDLGAFQTLVSEARDYYVDRYDVETVARTSALFGGRWCLVRDRVRAASDHAVTWQAFAAPGAAKDGEAVRVETPQGVAMLLVPDAPLEAELTPAPNMPYHLNVHGGGSTRVRLHGRTVGGAWDHAVCLVPFEALQASHPANRTLDRGWEAFFGGDEAVRIDLCDAVMLDPCTHGDRPRVFRKRLRLAQPESVTRLRLEKAVECTICRVNGQETLRVAEVKGERWNGFGTMPHIFDVTGLLRAGMNTIEFEAPFLHGETLAGPVRLLSPNPTQPEVAFCAEGGGVYRVTVDGGTDRVLLDNVAGQVRFGEAMTDARDALVAAGGFVAVAGAREFTSDTMTLSSRAPTDVSYEPGGKDGPLVTLHHPADNNLLLLAMTEGTLTVESTGGLSVRWTGKTPVRLAVLSSEPRPVTLNGEAQGLLAAATWGTFRLEPARGEAAVPKTPSQAYALMGSARAPAKVLHAAARGKDWRTALAAIDALALSGLGSGAELLTLLERERALRPDPPLSRWWRGAKMLHEAGPATPDTTTPVEQGAKRWRLRRALVSALGTLGCREAIPLLIRMVGEGREHFGVTSQLPLALARLDAREALPALERQWDHAEINTQRLARLAIRYLRGEITRTALEEAAPPG